jgi:hypothetical protein
MLLLIRIFFCIFGVGLFLYSYIDKQNELTELRLQIPRLAKEVKSIQEENHRLQYEIDYFESPIHLMELSRKPEFGHLKYPYVPNIIFLKDRNSLTMEDIERDFKSGEKK